MIHIVQLRFGIKVDDAIMLNELSIRKCSNSGIIEVLKNNVIEKQLLKCGNTIRIF